METERVISTRESDACSQSHGPQSRCAVDPVVGITKRKLPSAISVRPAISAIQQTVISSPAYPYVQRTHHIHCVERNEIDSSRHVSSRSSTSKTRHHEVWGVDLTTRPSLFTTTTTRELQLMRKDLPDPALPGRAWPDCRRSKLYMLLLVYAWVRRTSIAITRTFLSGDGGRCGFSPALKATTNQTESSRSPPSPCTRTARRI